MINKVKNWIERNHLIVGGDRVLAACSGGPDSVVLVHILHALTGDLGFQLKVAHVDHMLRGEASRADAAFVEAMCRSMGIPCYCTAVDVRREVRRGGGSEEEVARKLRYAFLQQVAAEWGGAKIATGHHLDDQAETVLINLLRGAGSTGLRGMQPKNGNIIRPLLNVSRVEIVDYCRQQQLAYRIDQSNFTTDYLRNRLRWELLPLLERDYNPNIKEILWRTALLAADEHDFLRQQAGKFWPELVTETADKLIIDTLRLSSLHIALQREILRLAIEKKRGSLTGITFLHVEKLIWLNENGRVGAIIELPGGILALKSYNRIELAAELPGSPLGESIPPPGIQLTIGGETPVPQLNLLVETVLSERQGDLPHDPLIAVFDWEQLVPPLYIRTRSPGDWFIPRGMSGRKKVKEWLIDAKVPRHLRDTIPIIADSQGILWLCGYRFAERAKVTENTRTVLQIKIKRRNLYA